LTTIADIVTAVFDYAEEHANLRRTVTRSGLEERIADVLDVRGDGPISEAFVIASDVYTGAPKKPPLCGYVEKCEDEYSRAVLEALEKKINPPYIGVSQEQIGLEEMKAMRNPLATVNSACDYPPTRKDLQEWDALPDNWRDTLEKWEQVPKKYKDGKQQITSGPNGMYFLAHPDYEPLKYDPATKQWELLGGLKDLDID
jgi:hypothetical protein